MTVGLFIPCYIDAFFPELEIATLELLERLGCSVEYPVDQTCCGQPMANSGCQEDAAATESWFVRCFHGFETIVGPSASCVHHVRFHLDAIASTPEAEAVRSGTRELVEFLHDTLDVPGFPWAKFPHRVGLHESCTAIRGLGHARPSELVNVPSFSKTRDLLRAPKSTPCFRACLSGHNRQRSRTRSGFPYFSGPDVRLTRSIEQTNRRFMSSSRG